MTHLHFDHCGGSVQWNKDKTGYEPAFKNAKFGAMKSNGQQNQTEREGFCLKIFCRCKKAGNLILSKDPKVTIWSNQN
jgi:glyoxylase-like metal-dependent hydrolase (beta-lactamase superfamily II)